MANRDIMAIGTSAGGVEALRFLAKSFRPDLPASVLVTIHLPSQYHSSLDAILSAAGPLPASFACNGETVAKQRIYLAPPGNHLLLDGDRLLLGSGPHENSSRPAIDPMLRSAALCCAGRAVGVVLTGTLGDGASGLWALREAGGVTVVQDPSDAAFSEMPQTALDRARPDHVAALAELPGVLDGLVRQPAGETKPAAQRLRFEVDVAKSGHSGMSDMDRTGRRSALSCPDCGGVMWEIDEGDLLRYRCHVGHAYTGEVMSLAVDGNLRRALAISRRALEERGALLQKMAEREAGNRHDKLALMWRQRAEEYNEQADAVEKAMQRLERVSAQSEPS